ncbi:Methyltransferase domain-containing protein [Pseudorhodobacter antarcticus]|uniref:Methyltransferase domain-containing protein n=1 Tax=Pseudorhodobacter antarcticus TaxID=1077947 RepID=A0A1H8N2L7_9RHOB|nr:class I SAM-dependent methyltransferase [Pseudorhodobacter antarcticus]SEO23857.1 Methyltransferase domain-containing protein [Pseudorhodobacter antarcticus]
MKNILNKVHSSAVMKRRVRVLAQALAEMFDSAGTVLDVGCGDGTVALSIEKLKPALEFSGVDVFLRPTVAIPAIVYDGKRIPYEDEAFDYAMIVDVLHHTDDPAAVLAECMRVTRKGVVIKDHLAEGFAARPILRFMDWVGNRGHNVRLPYNYLDKEEWRRVFKQIGSQEINAKVKLGLYPAPFGYLFDRSLHFVARIDETRRSNAVNAVSKNTGIFDHPE